MDSHTILHLPKPTNQPTKQTINPQSNREPSQKPTHQQLYSTLLDARAFALFEEQKLFEHAARTS